MAIPTAVLSATSGAWIVTIGAIGLTLIYYILLYSTALIAMKVKDLVGPISFCTNLVIVIAYFLYSTSYCPYICSGVIYANEDV